MTTGEKIQSLRRNQNITQEQLADFLGVTRQAVSRWEQDQAYPETDKLIKMSELFKVSVDYLLKEQSVKETTIVQIPVRTHYEYKSKKTIRGIPLVHINIGLGRYSAHGIIAIGNYAKGIVSIGLLSMGILSLGLLSVGILSIGVLAFGLISIATIAFGIFALGAIAIGIFSIGAISIGLFSYGALSVGHYVAIGDHAYGKIALGKTFASGNIYTSMGNGTQFIYDKNEVTRIINDTVPDYLFIFTSLIKTFL